jgi:hypothetical protein
MLKSGGPKIIGRLALDRDLIEKFLKSITYDIRVTKAGQIRYFRGNIEQLVKILTDLGNVWVAVAGEQVTRLVDREVGVAVLVCIDDDAQRRVQNRGWVDALQDRGQYHFCCLALVPTQGRWRWLSIRPSHASLPAPTGTRVLDIDLHDVFYW